jgi:hypothetical protein
LGVGHETNELTPEILTDRKPSENHGGGQDPHRVVAPVKKKKTSHENIWLSIIWEKWIL